MLVFLLKAKASYTISSYLEHWAPNLQSALSVRTYESLGKTGSLPAATYVFGDQERWSKREHRLGCDLWRQLAVAGNSHILLNDPSCVLLRFELLKVLHARGSNLFDVHRPLPALIRARFPVFLHSTNNHDGALSPLLTNRLQLLRWLVRRVRPRRWGRLLVEEFCDVSDGQGRFAKYSAFNLGGEIVPRHVFHGRNWCLKDTEIVDRQSSTVFDSYLSTNPHANELAEIFRVSGIDYGRIDYALKNGRIQVWEINTNPMIIGFPHTMRNDEEVQTKRANEMVQSHFQRLSRLPVQGPKVPYRLSGEFRR